MRRESDQGGQGSQTQFGGKVKSNKPRGRQEAFREIIARDQVNLDPEREQARNAVDRILKLFGRGNNGK